MVTHCLEEFQERGASNGEINYYNFCLKKFLLRVMCHTFLRRIQNTISDNVYYLNLSIVIPNDHFSYTTNHHKRFYIANMIIYSYISRLLVKNA